MIFKDKTDFTSDPFTVEDNKIFVTVANKGVVYLEVLEQDEEWRSFPQTTLLGPVSKYVAVPSEMSLRVKIPTLNTVSAYKAVAVEVVEEELPVDPPVEEPVDPPVEVPPVVIPPIELKQSGPSFGMNFASGTFSDHDVTKLPGIYNTHYTYPNKDTFSRWKARGVKHVRLPIRWERIQRTLNAPLDSVEAARILAVYDIAAAHEMVIVLDLHNYMQRAVNGAKYEIGTSQVPQAAYNDLWVRLVSLIGSHKASYGYGIMNEPMGTQGRWTGIAQSVVNAIRAVDPKTYIFVNGDQWATPLNWVAANPGFPLQGENLVYEAHLYFDKNAGGSYVDANEQIDPQVGVNRLTPYVNWLKKYGQEGVVGEVGWPANRPTAVAAARNTLAFAAANDVRVFGWMAGDWLDASNVLSIEVGGVAQAQLSVYQEFNKNMVQHGPIV